MCVGCTLCWNRRDYFYEKQRRDMNESVFEKLKHVRLADVGHIFLFLFALLPALFYRRKRPHLWLVAETETEARDNGYWFFRYLRNEQRQVDAVYAIRPDAAEYPTVAALGPTVNFGSFRHWVYYLAAEVNISSQKYGKPNAAVCYLLEVVLGVLKNRRVFLQHGVIKDDLPFLHWDKSRFWMFCCAAKPEYEFVRNTFGYPPGVVRHVGLCRFDGLYDTNADASLVLIVPTWRMWLERNRGADARQAFLNSKYYREWNGLLHSEAFMALLERYDKRVVFCLHRNMQAYETLFTSGCNRIQAVRWQDADIGTLLKQAGTLITDYSSVYMDFAYMKKPLVYFQFDDEDFRKGHLPAGYFQYAEDGFGPVCREVGSLIGALDAIFGDGCRMADAYRARVDRFYPLHDDKNSERTYRTIVQMLNEEKNKAL